MKTALVVIVAVFIIAGLIVFLQNQTKVAPVVNQSSSATQSRAIPSYAPAASVISKPAPVVINRVEGTISAVTGSSITVSVAGQTQTFNIATTKDIQNIVSGSASAGNTKTVAAAKTDLKVGQDVIIIADKNTNTVQSIYIVK